jgi:hypothetical protein
MSGETLEFFFQLQIINTFLNVSVHTTHIYANEHQPNALFVFAEKSLLYGKAQRWQNLATLSHILFGVF